jgi:4'-phosphopantetheinyl transferase superfamily protein
VREWLAPTEQMLAMTFDGPERDRVVNLVWTAKEAAAKVRREGLRLDVRRAVAGIPDAAVRGAAWRRLVVDWRAEGALTAGWWRDEPGWVMTIAGDPAPGPPRRLGGRAPTGGSRPSRR